MPKGAIWIPEERLEILDRFNHFKIDHGKKPYRALEQLLDIAEEKK